MVITSSSATCDTPKESLDVANIEDDLLYSQWCFVYISCGKLSSKGTGPGVKSCYLFINRVYDTETKQDLNFKTEKTNKQSNIKSEK